MSAITVTYEPVSIGSGTYDADDNEIMMDTFKVWVQSDLIKLAFYGWYGWAIGYLSEAGSNTNLVCDRDYGKLIQQSYYANWLAGENSSSFYAWNPIQGSAPNGASDGKLAFDVDEAAGTIYLKVAPGLWPHGATDQCTFEQWLTFDGPLLNVRYRFNYTGTQDRTEYQGIGASSIFAAEGPAAFFTSAIKNFVTYNGNAPWTNDPALNRSFSGARSIIPFPTERWCARVNSADWGVGVYDFSGDCNLWYISEDIYAAYVGADINWLGGLHVGDSKEFTRVFTIGNLSDIRQRFYNIHQPPPPLQKRPLKSSTGHGRISGKGGGRVSGKPS